MARKAEYFTGEGSGWRCALCPRGCSWAPGASSPGFCKVRAVRGGMPDLPGYGRCVSLSVDPVEKKPLYHFKPGSWILSTGPAGCNLSCDFCQNWNISQGGDIPSRYLAPGELASAALSGGSIGAAFTYTEPTIWFEYVKDTAPLIREKGGVTVMVSNGYVNPAPLRELIGLTDAWNVDLKGWSEDFYGHRCGGSREPVLGTIAELAASDCHLEITFLIIPGENDNPVEWERMARWLGSNCGHATPLHISRYFPRYRLKRPPTDHETLVSAREVFSEHLSHVFLGNVVGVSNDTFCPSCGGACVVRGSGLLDPDGVDDDGRCAACGEDTGIVR